MPESRSAYEVHNIITRRDPRRCSTQRPAHVEAVIRTLSVSLLAVAAIAASLLLTRGQEEEGGRLPHAGENQPVRLPLDALRAAGM